VLAHIHPSPFRFAYGPVSPQGSAPPGSASRCSLSSKPPSAQSPFALPRRYLFRWNFPSHQRVLPLFPRSYGLMRQALILPPPRLSPRPVGLCRLSPVLAGWWPFPTLSPYASPWMLGPIPRRLPRCFRPFLPRGLRPSPPFDRVGFLATYPCSDFRTALFLGAADIPLCSGLQVCSPPRSLQPIRPSPYGRRGFYFRASYSSLPPHTSDMLTARIGQLAVGDLHPIRLTALSATPKRLK
jgi:hypothetical protein